MGVWQTPPGVSRVSKWFVGIILPQATCWLILFAFGFTVINFVRLHFNFDVLNLKIINIIKVGRNVPMPRDPQGDKKTFISAQDNKKGSAVSVHLLYDVSTDNSTVRVK